MPEPVVATRRSYAGAVGGTESTGPGLAPGGPPAGGPVAAPPGPQRSPARSGSVWLVATAVAAVAGILLGIGLWGATGGASRPAPVAPAPAADPVRSGIVRGVLTVSPGEVPAGPAAGSATAGQPVVGECLVLSADRPPAAPEVVGCERPHHVEVVGLVEAVTRSGAAPTPAEWQQLLIGRCPEALRARLGTEHDPYGVVRLRVSAPGPAEWAGGDRVGECLAAVGRDVDGRPALWTGPVRAVDQNPVPVAGTCLAGDPLGETPVDAVPCAAPHQLQVTAALPLGGPSDRYPTAARWKALDAECAAAVPAGLTPPPGRRLVPVAVRIPAASWLLGRRTAACAVAAVDPATGRFDTLTTPLFG